MKNNYLVLGGNGFIGKNLCEYLLSKGKCVTSFDLFTPKNEVEGIKYIEGDFFDDKTLLKIVEDQEIIYHCLSTINPANSVTNYLSGYNKDFIQTIKLLDVALKANIKMVFLSSGGTVYGDIAKMPITEEAPCNPKNHYGNLKLTIENYIKVFNKINHTKHIIARISNPYGKGQDSTRGVGFIDAVIKNAMRNNEIEVWGDGSIVRDYIYIEDVCKMLYHLSLYVGENIIFNVSANCGETQNEIIDIVRKRIPNIKVCYKPPRDIDARKIILCNEKIKSLIKSEVININDGINMYIDYLQNIEKYNGN